MGLKKFLRSSGSRRPQGQTSTSTGQAELSESPNAESGAPESAVESDEQISFDMSSIWNCGPVTLPGPDDHPFFKELDKLKDGEKISGQAAEGTTDSTRASFVIPPPPPVYPFIPPPSVSLYSYPPSDVPFAEDKSPQATTSRGIPDSTPPSSPISPPQSREREPSNGHSLTPPNSKDSKEGSTRCKLSYSRALPRASGNGIAVLNGQVWANDTEKGKNWRRNQWVIEG